ncbi:MAG: sulfite reductase flavoprotein subunit alpha, partial [Opitutaceae bacterium]
MSTAPFIPDTAPFTPEQRAWLNGFFAGIFSHVPSAAAGLPASAPPPALTPLTILFGSQTGTAERLAKRAAKEAGKRSFAATVLDMAQTDVAKLVAEKNVLVIVSTYGDGEPPDSAKALHSQLAALSSKLPSLRYAVCALGDTNYAQFCKCGADFDTFLEKAGGQRVAARVDCDLEYEEKFTAWLNTSLSAIGSSSAPSSAPAAVEPATAKAENESGFSRSNPFPALLLTSRNLNAPGSAKQVHHIEFDLAGSGLAYEAGDALGVIPHNCPEQVAEVLSALACDGEEAVPAPDGSTVPLRRALTEFHDLGKPTTDLIALLNPVVAGFADPGQPRSTSPATTVPHHVIDVLLAATAKPAPTDFVRALKKIQPRLYSISSSPRAHAGQVHLTVGVVRYEKDGRPRKGVCSTFLADRGQPGAARVGVYVHSNKAFRPPPSPDIAAIMIGPGTGIAPFRAFLHERKATGA